MYRVKKGFQLKRPPTHYRILGCPPAATPAQLHTAYLDLAVKCHPDTVQDETEKAQLGEKFKALGLAWGVLKNKEFRARYDAELALLRLNCLACQGRGTSYRSIGFTGRKELLCTTCKGTGRNDL